MHHVLNPTVMNMAARNVMTTRNPSMRTSQKAAKKDASTPLRRYVTMRMARMAEITNVITDTKIEKLQ